MEEGLWQLKIESEIFEGKVLILVVMEEGLWLEESVFEMYPVSS